ncbi:Lactonase, 7-bladed beta-propeller-domain-containing protein [Pelagophyceae sp. CCMP2097]|nr:Lactonase, 7-bladed beta-propeller-domain-containing protein [Pelagophyceae sp. CCMP2097]
MEYLVAVSTYTNTKILAHTPKGEESRCGIECLWLDAATGVLRPACGVDIQPNPAFIVQHPHNEGVVYATTERIDENGAVHSLRLTRREDGGLELRAVDETSAKGKSTCYVGVDRTGRWLRVTNYWDATVAVCPIDGARLGDICDVHALPPCAVQPTFGKRCERGADYCETHKPTREEHWAFRQRWPHAHCVVTEPYDEQVHFVVDLGEDAIYHYGFDAALGQMLCRGATQLARGGGPRHLVFHARRRAAFVVNELVSTVSAFKLQGDGGGDACRQTTDAGAVLRLADTCTTLPAGFDNAHRVCPVRGIWTAESHAGEIRIDGDWLFVANRGHNSIAVFKISFDAADEPALSLVSVTGTLGKCPRNFAVIGDHVIVGNQDSNELRVFGRCYETGALRPRSVFQIASPNFVTVLTPPKHFDGHTVAVEHHAAPAAAFAEARPLAEIFCQPPDFAKHARPQEAAPPAASGNARALVALFGIGAVAIAAVAIMG